MKITHVVIALLVFAAGIAATATVDRFLSNVENERAVAAAEASSQSAAAAIYAHMESRVHSLERMAKRLQRDYGNNGTFTLEIWQEDAEEYVTDQPGHMGLELYDAEITQLASTNTLSSAIAGRLFKGIDEQNTYDITPGPIHAATAHARGTIALDNGDHVLAIAFPLFSAEKPIGYLISYSDVSQTLSSVLQQKFEETPEVWVQENGHLIFQNSTARDATLPIAALPNIAEGGNVTWAVQARKPRAPGGSQLAQNSHWVQIVGGILSLLAALVAYLLLANRRSLARAKVSEEQLREESRLRDLVLEHSPDLIFVKDKAFRLRELNPAMHALYGDTPLEDILGKTTIEDYSKEEAEEFLKLDRLAFAEGRSETEERIVFPNGEERTLLTTKIRFEDETGEPYILGVARNITALKRYESELRESEERYKLAFEGTSVGLMDWDCTTGEIYYSELVKKILGVTNGEFSPNFDEFTQRVHPDDRASALNSIREHLENHTPYQSDYRVRHESGEYLWMHSRGQATWDENGKPTRMLGSLDDITEKTVAQNELLRSYEELDNFAYIASHDLKEPLRGVNNHARFLEEDYKEVLGEDGKHRIERMLFLTQHMGKLIDDLLEYSRISRQKADNQVVNLNTVVEEIAQSYESEEVEIVIASELPTVQCSAVQLGMLFRNLVANGLKYNESDEKRVVISCQAGDPLVAGKKTTYSVCDNGIGIAPKFRDDVFKIFKRLHDVSTYGGGTGSGLTFAKKIVEKYQGDIWITDNTPTGTCLRSTLPDAELAKAME